VAPLTFGTVEYAKVDIFPINGNYGLARWLM
ncbi:MAG: hypothetical protein RL595_1767, partial [Planctomycetota bacterium]